MNFDGRKEQARVGARLGQLEAQRDILRDHLQSICEMQEKNYGDGMSTHMALDLLCREARAAIKATEDTP